MAPLPLCSNDAKSFTLARILTVFKQVEIKLCKSFARPGWCMCDHDVATCKALCFFYFGQLPGGLRWTHPLDRRVLSLLPRAQHA